MLAEDDIQKLIESQQEVFATKEDLLNLKDELRKDFSNLVTRVDAYAKKADTYFQEMVMLSHKIDRHEKWIQQLAEKLGVNLSF
ncbi:MAG: hypothetical protein PHW31_01115 [Candidatus Pacebacteria bacterium]|nr:hypothetical protein [Candidatus Paceibacterota bacterium]